ncbi:MAG: hypothetical protein LWW77_05035 [Propionibacteriales bacterium]|nr:hypothetical protein [Propionibacteriales bacterium]
MRSSLTQLVAELSSLTRHTVRVLGRLWAPVLSLMLLGWATQQLSILIATEVSAVWAWGVIIVLAVGAVIQLATVIAVLRVVAVDLGLPKMLAEASTVESVDDDRDTSLVALLNITILPFLAMYVAFGYLQDYAARLTIVATYRKGIGDLLGALNPLENTTTLIVMLVLLGAGFIFKRLVDPWQRRTRHPLVVGGIQIMVEACLAFVVLLGGYRVYQSFSLWWDSRRVSAWLDHATSAVLAPVPSEVTNAVAATWQALSGQLWPVLVDGLARPLLWLAMAGLVFGSRVLTLADLWRLGRPVTHTATRREQVLARLQSQSSTARGVRAIVLKAQTLAASGIDDTVIPAWQSLRLVVRAGWPFLGAFVIGFTALDLVGKQLEVWVTRLIGGQLVGVWIKIYPFLDLLPLVLVMGVTWVFLAVAYTRALSIFAGEAGETVAPVLVPQVPGVLRSLRTSRVQAITVILVTALVVAGAAAVPATPGSQVVHASVLTSTDLHGQQVSVDHPRFATAISIGGKTVTTDELFVIVRVQVRNPGPKPGSVVATFVSGQSRYPTWDFGGTPTAPPGFLVAQDVVFEVDPSAVTPDARLVFSAVGENIALHGYQKTLEVDLALPPGAVAATQEVITVSDMPERVGA